MQMHVRMAEDITYKKRKTNLKNVKGEPGTSGSRL
jgi:hypothetical protein